MVGMNASDGKGKLCRVERLNKEGIKNWSEERA